jgi:hypothetical protein
VVRGFGGTGGGLIDRTIVRFGDLGGTGGGKAGEGKAGGRYDPEVETRKKIYDFGWCGWCRSKCYEGLVNGEYGLFGLETLNKPEPHDGDDG